MLTIRVIFTKKDEAAYISLLDLQRVVGRAIKRSKIPAWYSKGFNPHIYMTFAAPLALGQHSLCEIMDFKTEAENIDWQDAKEHLTTCLPRGIDVIYMGEAIESADKIAFAEYEISYSEQNYTAFKSSCEIYNNLESANVEKKTKRGTKQINLKSYISLISCESYKTKLILPAGSEMNINPMLLLGFLQTLNGAPTQSADIMRLRLLDKDYQTFC